MSKILFKATKGDAQNYNLEIIFDLFKFNNSNAIEFKVEDGAEKNFKTLWLKKNCKEVGIYVANKLQSSLFDNLENTYEYVLKNKNNLFLKHNSIQIKYNKGKKLLATFSLIELDAIIELLQVLNKKKEINKKVKALKSTVNLKPIESFQEEKKKEKKKNISLKVEQNNKYFVRVNFSNSSIREYTENQSYEDALKLYSDCKEKYTKEIISLVKVINGKEQILYTKDLTENKESNKQLVLLEKLSEVCKEINDTRESLKSKLSVLDKKINICLHEIENKSFDNENIMEYKTTVDRLKVLLDERRDVKKAFMANDKAYSKISAIENIDSDYQKTINSIKKYEETASNYVDEKVDVKTYAYKTEEEFKYLYSHFSSDTVKHNPEKKEIYVYKKHCS